MLNTVISFVLAILIAVTFSACGGGGGSDDTPAQSSSSMTLNSSSSQVSSSSEASRSSTAATSSSSYSSLNESSSSIAPALPLLYGFIHDDTTQTEENGGYYNVQNVFYDVDQDGLVDLEDPRTSFLSASVDDSYINAFTTLASVGLSIAEINALLGSSITQVDFDISAITDYSIIKAHLKAIVIINDILLQKEETNERSVSGDLFDTVKAFFENEDTIDETTTQKLSENAQTSLDVVDKSDSVESLQETNINSVLNANVSSMIRTKEGLQQLFDHADNIQKFIEASHDYIDTCTPIDLTGGQCAQLVEYLASPFLYDFLDLQYDDTKLNILENYYFYWQLANGKTLYLNHARALHQALGAIADQVTHTAVLEYGCSGNDSLTFTKIQPQYTSAAYPNAVLNVETTNSTFKKTLKLDSLGCDLVEVKVFNFALMSYHLLRMGDAYQENGMSEAIASKIDDFKCYDGAYAQEMLDNLHAGLDAAILEELSTTPNIEYAWLVGTEWDYFNGMSNSKISEFESTLADMFSDIPNALLNDPIPDYILKIDNQLEAGINVVITGFKPWFLSAKQATLFSGYTGLVTVSEMYDTYLEYAEWSDEYLDRIDQAFDKGYFLETYLNVLKNSKYTGFNYTLSDDTDIGYIPSAYSNYPKYLLELKASLYDGVCAGGSSSSMSSSSSSSSKSSSSLSSASSSSAQSSGSSQSSVSSGSQSSGTSSSSGSIDLTSGLVAHYEFEGNANDSSGKGNDGTVFGDVTYNSGVIGDSAVFDNGYTNDLFNTDQYIVLPKTTSNEMTISHWVKYESIGSPHSGVTYSLGASTAGEDTGMQIRVNIDGTILAILRDVEYGVNTESYDLSDQLWHHVVVSFDQTKLSLYVDGTPIDNAVIDFVYDITNLEQYIALHKWYGGSASASRFNGSIDDLRIYNRALTESEIQQLYKMGNIDAPIIHNGVTYGTVTSLFTGREWLDRNLGASRVCQSQFDQECFGDYYQWGRNADGHEKMTSATTNSPASSIDPVGHGDFITNGDNDWATIDSDGSIRKANWGKTDGSSICPVGFRVPTIAELAAETMDQDISDSQMAYESFLKIPTAGFRDHNVGAHGGKNERTILYSTDVEGTKSYKLFMNIDPNSIQITEDFRNNGRSIRCIKN